MTESFIATKDYNFKTCSGELAEGCKRCVKGEKLVLFVTGVCGNGCSYCPVSDEKNLHDVTFANERKSVSPKEVLEEARMMNATGAGITGGDPLAVISRTCEYIKLFKATFGKDFHIHLYTPTLRLTKKNLDRLYEVGLDEIRIHPTIDNDKDWDRLLLIKDYDWQKGVEVPLLIDKEKELKSLLDFLAKNKIVDFINFNEFEYADNHVFEKAGVHYEPKNSLSYGVKGSVELGKRLLTYAESLHLAAHLCTAKSKDAIQLAQRLERRAKKAAQPFDAVDDEGLLTRGAIYFGLSIIEEGYSQKLLLVTKEEKESILEDLEELQELLIKEWDVPEELLFIDAERLRLLTTTSVAEAVAEELNYTVALVKEYPTHDCFIVEADILKRKL